MSLNNMIQWIITDSEKYKLAPEKKTNGLYFLQDTGEIYKGEKSFTEAVNLVTEFPAEGGALGKLYVHSTTLEGKVWNGSAWTTVVQPVANTVEDDSVKPVTGHAVQTYVAGEFAKNLAGKYVDGITYDDETKELSYTIDGGEPVKVGINGFITDASYDGMTGNLTFTVQGGEEVVVNMPKEDFVTSGKYEADSQEIVLTLAQGGEVRIPAASLVDVYTGKETQTATVTVSEGNEISVDVRVSAEGGNQIIKKEDGLFVAETDISGKLDKVEAEKAGELVIAKADGQVEVSGVKVGSASLGFESDDKTLATEAAVSEAITNLTSVLLYKVDKTDIVQTAASSVDEASEIKILSEKAVLMAMQAMNADITDRIEKDSIVATINPEEASEDRVVSEKALVEAMSWTTIN